MNLEHNKLRQNFGMVGNYDSGFILLSACSCFLQWAYGVTCWEVFTGGKTPYPGISPADIPRQLAIGYRLQNPMNNACNDEM